MVYRVAIGGEGVGFWECELRIPQVSLVRGLGFRVRGLKLGVKTRNMNGQAARVLEPVYTPYTPSKAPTQRLQNPLIKEYPKS